MFFGLTTLGPQNAFHHCKKDHSILTVFQTGEFEAAFKRVAGNADEVPQSKLTEILELVYHGPVPEADLRRCAKFAPTSAYMVLHDFLDCIKAAQSDEEEWHKEEKNRVAGTAEFNTSSAYLESMTRHTRMRQGPKQKYSEPLTSSMDVGWVKSTAPPEKRMAKKSCEETIYAAELIKAGVYY
ncbi:hypothetical protein M885DRAFT_511043 [Pelagophyceae sp. CCMP2097]|nr:hypothetical protein M885DRAFT_511043 [Pelagophyceae sp. CCMP2097]